MIINPSTVWDVPNTDPKAKPSAYQKAPSGRRIVHVLRGTYRSAPVSGYFVIADVTKPYSTYAKKSRVEVECLWYGRKAPNNWPRITILEGGDVVNGYAGDVVTNISGTKKRRS